MYHHFLRQSLRLNISADLQNAWRGYDNINKCLGDLDTNMATSCCDTIEQIFFMNKELENLTDLFGPGS
jgi:hypothetical protein